jgi:hypothetical protein
MFTTGRITFKGIPLADDGYLSTSLNSNNTTTVIPRAKGVKIRSTKQNGGGYLTINISGALCKNSRYDIEYYLANFAETFSVTEPGSLVITNGSETFTLTDCYMETFSSDPTHQRLTNFTATFIKSL